MKKIIKNSYLFIILFLLIILKEPIYKFINVKSDIYTPLRCNILEDDYNKLLEFSEIDYIYESDYLNTYIIYKDIYNYLGEITIRGGKDYDFKDNMVVYDNTLVGVINKVNDSTSNVLLLTNNNSKISVKINDEIGLLEYKDGKLIVSNLANNSNINIGDNIYTSGLGKTKENIYIGEVESISLENKDIEKRVVVKYNLDIKDIDYVTVIKENK